MSIETALRKAIRGSAQDGAVWRTPDVRHVAELLERIGTVPDGDRAKIMEHAVAGAAVLALVRNGRRLAAGKWYAKSGSHGGERVFVVALVVEDECYDMLRGRSPSDWPLAAPPEE